ncbi:MAG: hypothetical protein RR942_06450 [Romboutsia sp.]
MKKIKIKQVLKRANKKDLDIIISFEERYGGTTYTVGREDLILKDRVIKIKVHVPELSEFVPYQNVRWIKCHRK